MFEYSFLIGGIGIMCGYLRRKTKRQNEGERTASEVGASERI